MMYDLLDEAPEPGSVLEALCLMVQMRREATELFKTFSFLQAMRTDPKDSGEAVKDAFNKYRDSLMPFLEGEVSKEHDQLVRALREEISRAPALRVSSLAPQAAASQLRKKLKDREIRRPRWQRKRKR